MSQADLTMGAHSAGMMSERPFSMPTKKLAMWLFIIADTMTFAACLVAYGFLRIGTPNWPRPFHSITNVAVMTFILLTSSLTMMLGVQSARTGDKAGAFRWTMITAVLGIVFALLHIREWLALIDEGMTLFKESVGNGIVWCVIFQHHRFAPHARYLWRYRPHRRRLALQRWPLQFRRSRNFGPLLALRRFGLDVRGTAGLSVESFPLDGRK